MGKYFSALERFEKERLVESVKPKLKKADYIALIKYDRMTGQLDLYDREIIEDIETPQRLLDNNLIFPDGKLSPAGLSLCNKHEYPKNR
jgi:hypothetical protein